jgi:hypothetical protein
MRRENSLYDLLCSSLISVSCDPSIAGLKQGVDLVTIRHR